MVSSDKPFVVFLTFSQAGAENLSNCMSSRRGFERSPWTKVSYSASEDTFNTLQRKKEASKYISLIKAICQGLTL